MVFVIDTSDSMGEGPTARIQAALGASLALASKANLNRDQVCLITFRDRSAHLVVPPTSSVTRVRQEMSRLPVGGATPLAAGLQQAHEVIRQARIKDCGVETLLVLLSDGEATVPLEPGADPVTEVLTIADHLYREKIPALVIDALERQRPANLMARLAAALGAEYRPIHLLRADRVLELIDRQG